MDPMVAGAYALLPLCSRRPSIIGVIKAIRKQIIYPDFLKLVTMCLRRNRTLYHDTYDHIYYVIVAMTNGLWR
jgi:hypothetical protein